MDTTKIVTSGYSTLDQGSYLLGKVQHINVWQNFIMNSSATSYMSIAFLPSIPKKTTTSFVSCTLFYGTLAFPTIIKYGDPANPTTIYAYISTEIHNAVPNGKSAQVALCFEYLIA